MWSGQARVNFRWKSTAAALVALFLLAFQVCLPAGASQLPDLVTPVAFSTIASGLLPTTADETAIAIASFVIDQGVVSDDPASGAPGIVIVSNGSVVILDDEGNPLALLETGDAYWLNGDTVYQTRSLSERASFWRVGIGSGLNARDWGGDDPYTFTMQGQDPGDQSKVTPYVVRLGIVPDGGFTSLGGDEESVAYVFALAGSAEIDGKTLDEGTYLSPLSNNPGVEATDGAAYIGYIARGPATSVTGDDADTEPVAPPVDAGSGDDSSDDTTGTDDGTEDTGTDDAPTDDPIDLTDLDTDGDGLNDGFEGEIGTDPNNPDSDGDGLTDRQEAIELNLGTDPNNPDSDNDGLTDGAEVNGAVITHPFNSDTDNDSLSDGFEVNEFGSSPVNPDTDGDGLMDFDESIVGSNPLVADTDADGVNDVTEVANGTFPNDPNSK